LILAAHGDETSIILSGSQQLQPLLGALTAEFRKEQPSLMVNLREAESIESLESLVSGEVSIAVLDRPLSPDEAHRFRNADGEPLRGLPIALDAVVVFVNAENSLRALTAEQVKAIFTYQVQKWADLGVMLTPTPAEDPRHVHGPDCVLDHPKEAFIRRYLPSEQSAARVVMRSRILKEKDFARDARIQHSDRDVVNAVINDPQGIGIGTMGYTGNTHVLAIQMDAGSDPIAPSTENVRSRRYPLAHYVYLYSAGSPTEPVRAFLAFAISSEGQQVVTSQANGLLPLPIYKNHEN